MRRTWDIELIFPIKDAASAALMVIKADCLHNAGVISDGEKQWVRSRARPFLADGSLLVTLSGTVPSPDAISKAMLLAMETDGVKEVISTLQVKSKTG